MRVRASAVAACLAALLLGTTGCGGDPAPGDGSAGPAFEGPWAEDFAAAHRSATTGEQRQMLADGVVSDAEYAQVREAFAQCLAEAGYAVTWTANGGFTLDAGSPDVPEELVQERVESCDVEHRGSVDYLYEQVARNPENLDEAEIMAACLVRRDVVAPSFSADDYRRWYDTQGGLLPFTVDERTGERVFDECNADPLGLHG
ncbi:hypothetical protein [Cellulomonas denverensis]|uniref:Lipoprotein n=2 Tax=Cellulomonas denverensis TaxID=264297 RepID=A0A7X6KWG2_9CELL|nr:hypothetical protein [Cellulomonas denverensis]NKY23433.1 hypothetical protein [Cellulomonas denverensis]